MPNPQIRNVFNVYTTRGFGGGVVFKIVDGRLRRQRTKDDHKSSPLHFIGELTSTKEIHKHQCFLALERREKKAVTIVYPVNAYVNKNAKNTQTLVFIALVRRVDSQLNTLTNLSLNTRKQFTVYSACYDTERISIIIYRFNRIQQHPNKSTYSIIFSIFWFKLRPAYLYYSVDKMHCFFIYSCIIAFSCFCCIRFLLVIICSSSSGSSSS